MILAIQDRNKGIHLIGYIYGNTKYTFCGLIYSNSPDIINTFYIDSPLSNICKQCNDHFKDTYDWELDECPRFWKSKDQEHFMREKKSIRGKYAVVDSSTNWSKLVKYKLKAKRRNDTKY